MLGKVLESKNLLISSLILINCVSGSIFIRDNCEEATPAPLKIPLGQYVLNASIYYSIDGNPEIYPFIPDPKY